MAYAIQSFQCTKLGLKHLQLAKINNKSETAVALTETEIECLLLIHEYRNVNANLPQLSKLELKFQNLYESVNLTRLVVMKLLQFFDIPVPNPNLIQDNPENIGAKSFQEVETSESNSSKLFKKIESVTQQPKFTANQKEKMVDFSVDPILVIAAGSFED